MEKKQQQNGQKVLLIIWRMTADPMKPAPPVMSSFFEIIVVALMDTLSGTQCDEPNAHDIYHRAAQLTNRPCVHTVKTASAA